MSKKLFFLISTVFFLIFFVRTTIYADPPDELDSGEVYVRARVLVVLKSGIVSFDGMKIHEETLKVQLLEGREKGKVVTVTRSGDPTVTANQIAQGETVVIDSKPDPTGKITYTVYEPYRLNVFLFVFLGFLLFIIVIAGKRGVGALVGLGTSIGVIGMYIIPQILQGKSPLNVCIIGACIILFVTTYLAHGVSLKTTVAVVGTAISLLFAGWLSVFFVNWLHIFGLGNEDIYNLQVGTAHPINPQGLFLGSILIGTLGALNDITTTQAITMFTLVKENPKQKLQELFTKGMTIGKEHIASLINTLVLAYAGSSLAVFIFFELNPAHLPWWVILNNESTIEELVKSMVGSSALILAVPLTTLLATAIALKGTSFLDFLIEIGIDLGIVRELPRGIKQKK